jgi:hypothetical protein
MTIAIDFDGVIHAYSQGWADGTIYDPPLPGALDGLRALMDRDSVFVFTTRDPEQVAPWLRRYGFAARPDYDDERTFWDELGTLLVTNKKLAARFYIDDRALRFESWPQTIASLDAAHAASDSCHLVDLADGSTARVHGQGELTDEGREALAAVVAAAHAKLAAETRPHTADDTDAIDAVYRERAHLVAYMAAINPAVLVEDTPDAPGWSIVYIVAGGHQMSWHIAHRDLDLFKHVPRVPAGDPRAQWDGHTTDQKYVRLRSHTRLTHMRRVGAHLNPEVSPR